MDKNSEFRQITVVEMAPHVHSFLPNENKVIKIANWLEKWIKIALESGEIKFHDYLPSKRDLAFHIGVSLGTVHNSFRLLEDKGIIESRQKIGSYIKNPDANVLEKPTSKREYVCEILKKHIIMSNYKVGDKLISIRQLAEILNCPTATIRISINTLLSNGILEQRKKSFYIKKLKFNISYTEPKTLVEKTAELINLYINKNLTNGDKLPSNHTLADMYNVSIKTINDAIKILSDSGIVKSKRGLYGTYVSGYEENNNFYCYEQVELKIKKYINENCKPGDRLLSIREFAEVFNVSIKTIKKALDNIKESGYIRFAHGRNGGSYVVDIPVISDKGYEWLALSPEYELGNN